MHRASWLLLPAGIAATAVSFAIPDAKFFPDERLARIICWHLPCAFLTVVFVCLAAWFGLKLLKGGEMVWDHRLSAVIELGVIFGSLTMATGIIFSKVQWNSWWQWDPRQTSFLMVLLLLLAGLALRAGFQDELRRARASAAYSLVSFLPAFFLTFVYPRLPHVQRMSFHPSQSIAGGLIDRNYWLGILSVFIVLALMSRILYRSRVTVLNLQTHFENKNGKLEMDRHAAAATGVVRPVRLHDEAGGEAESAGATGQPRD